MTNCSILHFDCEKRLVEVNFEGDKDVFRFHVENGIKEHSWILDTYYSQSDHYLFQSKLTFNNFYDRYYSKLEDYNNDLNFEIISNKYSTQRDFLINISKTVTDYLDLRKHLLVSLVDLGNSYEYCIDDLEDYINTNVK